MRQHQRRFHRVPVQKGEVGLLLELKDTIVQSTKKFTKLKLCFRLKKKKKGSTTYRTDFVQVRYEKLFCVRFFFSF